MGYCETNQAIVKKQLAVYIILTILFLGLLWWWHRGGNSSTSAFRSMTVAPSVNGTGSTTSRLLTGSVPIPPGVSPTIGQPTLNPTTGQMEVRINPALPPGTQMQIILDAQNGREIDTYGKVIDQYGTPVDGADVIGGTFVISPDGSGGQKFSTETNGQGLFSFTGLHGSDFGVIISKEGYEYNQRPYLDWFKGYKPEPANPMVFTIYKLQGAEPMVHTSFASWIPYDGTPITFDLTTGKKSDSGDLKVTLIRDPLKIKRGRDHFDWDVDIEIAGGGLVESHDIYPYEAPESGYVADFEFSVKKDDPHWTQKLVQEFYVLTNKGQYGRMHFDLTTDSDRPEGTGFEVEVYLNPSGSRDLEFDRKQQVKP
jgi:hypothetical protein